ncbi:uncharacterized protein [Misgurnus anguillicaudatus]|uniref:uncharacterized protein isoform X1 n=1 Tax=Misgurnus anguillicaudatus TaxID=75329 RepID=UPI002435B6D8|nr:dr1-associated corepressor isoform X1 [Misgurnus anguillicaudatus]XP_055027826.1 dr1-associated corepressor isoform X1 [Misgurnus anguillicaudatus]XP_055027827.1 dr1-associated corepressor isoform X1 [Misgurnus anguillicaudatus]
MAICTSSRKMTQNFYKLCKASDIEWLNVSSSCSTLGQGRIKKIMQKDTEVGRIATAVPVIISKALEIFLKSLITMTSKITQSRNSRVMSINHMKQCIHSEKLFDFLKDLADQASAASTSESKTKGKWQSHRKRWQSVPFKARSPEREKLPEKSTNDRVINSDSSSESELFICLETHSP